MIFSVHEEGSALVGRHSHGPWSFLFWMRHSARSGQSVLWTVLWKWPTHLSYDITSSSTCQLISLKTAMSPMHFPVSLLHVTCNRNTQGNPCNTESLFTSIWYDYLSTHYLRTYIRTTMRLAVWLSGNALASINVVALRQTRLVLGWVTACGRVNHFGM